MKTNFLHFKEQGSQTFTYVSGGQTFTLADAGGANFDEDIAADTRVKVVVTAWSVIVKLNSTDNL